MKKGLMLLICILCGTAVIFGGGQSSSGRAGTQTAGRDTITLRLWGGVQPEYGYDTLVANFNREYASKGIQLEYIRYMNDTNGNVQLETYLTAGGEIDVFLGYGGNARLVPRIESGLLVDMTDMLKEKSFDYIGELGVNNVSGYIYNGRAYALPTKYENDCWIFANVERFKEAGIPIPYSGWTFDEFRDASRKLTRGSGQNKEYGMWWGVLQGAASNTVRNIISSVLGKYATYKDDAKTETNFDHPIWAQGLQLMVDTMRNDQTAITLEDEVADRIGFDQAFLTGKTAMAVGIAQIRLIKDLNEYPHNFTTAVIPAPIPSRDYWQLADHNLKPGAGDLISISSRTRYLEESMDLVLWYIKGGIAPLAWGGRIPLWTGVEKQSVLNAIMDGAEGVFDRESLLSYISIDFRQAVTEEAGPALSQVTTAISEELQAALYGRKTVQQALSDAKTRGDALIRSVPR